MSYLTPREIGERRRIEYIKIDQGQGEIWLNGKIERFRFDDVLDLAQLLEMLMLKHSAKMLQPKFRPAITDRTALKFDTIKAGDPGLYDGDDAPMLAPGSFYMRVEIDGARWDNWFTRLDELVKLLYIVVKEAQGDPYVPPPSIFVTGAHGHA